MTEKANIIVKFMLSARKRKGIYFFAGCTLVITVALFFLAVFLYGQQLPRRRLAILFTLIGNLLFFFSVWLLIASEKRDMLALLSQMKE